MLIYILLDVKRIIKVIFIVLFIVLKFYIIYIFIFTNKICTANDIEKSVNVYYCKITDGTIGYYDRPCKYILNHKNNKLNENLNEKSSSPKKLYLITEKLLTLKAIKYSTKSNIHDSTKNYNIYNNDTEQLNPINKKHVDLNTKRCANALNKIPLINELLEKHQTLSQNSNNNEIIKKLKRSLTRYKKIKIKYCTNQS